MKNKGKGNRQAQVKRRKERLKLKPERQNEQHQLIDGNWSFYPVGYCSRYGAYLTTGLVSTHRCLDRECARFRKMGDDNE